MKKAQFILLILALILMYACEKKDSKKDMAINLVKAEYGDVRLDFDSSKLDSMYNISPIAYADSMAKGKELDEQLAELETQIEHSPQIASDSIGRISADLTKQRYRLLNVENKAPKFVGWKLSGVLVLGKHAKALEFNFDKELTKIAK